MTWGKRLIRKDTSRVARFRGKKKERKEGRKKRKLQGYPVKSEFQIKNGFFDFVSNIAWETLIF